MRRDMQSKSILTTLLLCSYNHLLFRSSSAANRFVLLRWECALYTVKVSEDQDFPSTRAWSAVLEAMALLYDSLQDESTPAKDSVRRTSVMCTRRALRVVRSPLVHLYPS